MIGNSSKTCNTFSTASGRTVGKTITTADRILNGGRSPQDRFSAFFAGSVGVQHGRRGCEGLAGTQRSMAGHLWTAPKSQNVLQAGWRRNLGLPGIEAKARECDESGFYWHSSEADR